MRRGKGGNRAAVHRDFADCHDIHRSARQTDGRAEDHGPESGCPADPADSETRPDHSVRADSRVRIAVARRKAAGRSARRLQAPEMHCSAAGTHSRARKEKQTGRTARSNRRRRRTRTSRLLPAGAGRSEPTPEPPGRRQSIGNNAQHAAGSSLPQQDLRRYVRRAPAEDIFRRHAARFRKSSRPDRSIRKSASAGSARGDCSSAGRAFACFDLVSLPFPVIHLVGPAHDCERFTVRQHCRAACRRVVAALGRIRVSAVLLEDRTRCDACLLAPPASTRQFEAHQRSSASA